MKFPSIQSLVQATLSTFKRFPLTIVFVLIACFYGLRISHDTFVNKNSSGVEVHYYYINIIWSAYLGMLLSLNVFLFSEKNRLSSGIKWLAGLFTVALVILFYFSLPDYFNAGRLKQFILFMAGLHLLVAFIPFTTSGEVNGFWQYNKTLFLRLLAAVLYSMVLFIGLSLAILAIEKLFSVTVKYKWYMDLWICIFGGFSSIFFLSGFPAQFENLEINKDYPKGLKIFTQYVLLPIITVYLVILYAYMVKIVGTHQWPYGWVSYLVLAFAVAGILSLLLIHPIRLEASNKWILGFSRLYYLAICPLIILLFLAIERRIHDYGVTEERYIVLGLACWLAFISLYFIFSKSKNIKIIPVSLCLIALFISFGPWGIFSVSLNSQSKRLKRYLKSNGMFTENQKIIPAKGPLHSGDASQISSIVEYLVNAHGYKSMQPLFSQNLDTVLKDELSRGRYYSYLQSQKINSILRVSEFANEPEMEQYFSVVPDTKDSLIVLSGYDYILNDYEIDINAYDSVPNIWYKGRNPLEILFIAHSGRLSLKGGSDTAVRFDLKALIKTLKKNNFSYAGDEVKFKQADLILVGENKDFTTKIIFQEINGECSSVKIQINHLTANILVHFKAPGSK